jgi:hypothetical protein
MMQEDDFDECPPYPSDQQSKCRYFIQRLESLDKEGIRQLKNFLSELSQEADEHSNIFGKKRNSFHSPRVNSINN